MIEYKKNKEKVSAYYGNEFTTYNVIIDSVKKYVIVNEKYGYNNFVVKDLSNKEIASFNKLIKAKKYIKSIA